MKETIRFCKRCLMPSTRPRIGFNSEGVCNACLWAEEKKSINWNARYNELVTLCEKHKKINKGKFNCIVPVSGGKDSSYVAYKIKYEFGMNPLCITINPPLAKKVGEANLKRFTEAGFDLISITPNPKITQVVSKIGFTQFGQPLYSWMMNVQAAIFRLAVELKIPLVMFGEEGETEYGGTDRLKHSHSYDVEHSIKVYLSGFNPKNLLEHFPDNQLYWWLFPSEQEIRDLKLEVSHFSYFENWDPYKHYLVAKDKCGLKEEKGRCMSTYNNFAQTDTILYDLHTYLMYLKFGFGRCTQDVGIDIRRGALDREQGLTLVKKYDGERLPEEYIEEYLKFFDMTREEFDAVLDKFANKELLNKVNGIWVRNFETK